MKFTRKQLTVLPSCLNQLVLCLFCFELVNGTTNLNYTTEASTSKRPDHPDDADKLPLVLPVEMHQIFPKGRLPKGYKDVAWDLIPWEAPSELKQTLRYLPNKCKRGFQSCLLKDQTPSNYCDAASKSESCIKSSGCSEREFRFIHLASCNMNTTNKPNPVDWSQNDWMVNVLLKNTVENLSTKCLRQFEQCRDYVSVVKSYCDMMVVMAPTVWGSPERKLREGCLDVDCPESDVLDLVDAACTRSVVSWDDAAVNRWFAGTRLQVATASLQLDCQEQLEFCKENLTESFDNKTGSDSKDDQDYNYCTVASVHRDCLWGAAYSGDICTEDETEVIYNGACNREQFNHKLPGGASTFNRGIYLQLAIAFLCFLSMSR